MGQHWPELGDHESAALLRWIVALAGIIAAVAALAIPGGASQTAQIASVLALGAIALAAGHLWGLAIVAIADVLLVAALWPLAVYHDPPSLPAQIAVYTALGASLPGLALVRTAAPRALELVWGRALSCKSHRIGAAVTTLAATAWIALPLVA